MEDVCGDGLDDGDRSMYLLEMISRAVFVWERMVSGGRGGRKGPAKHTQTGNLVFVGRKNKCRQTSLEV